MSELVLSVAAFLTWLVLWAVAAALLTALSAVAATAVERYLVVTDKWTFPLWIAALWASPAVASAMNWTLWGLIASERHFNAVRWGCVAGAGALAAAGVIVVTCRRGKEGWKEEVATLAGALAVAALCCAAMIWRFEPIAQYMRDLGE